jgi:hypothetical protein
MKMMKILLLTCTPLFFFCTLNMPDDPKPPKWDLVIEQIPLFKADTLRLGDELKPKDFTRAGTDSLLSVTKNDEKNFYIGDKLAIPARNESITDQIGMFEIEGGDPINHEIQFIELYPGLSAAVGTSVPIPGTSIPTIKRTTDFDGFVSVSIVSGGFQIDILNHLGFVLGNDVTLDLYDLTNNSLINQVNFDPIPNQQTGNYFIDLAGKTISSNLEVRIHGSLVGSSGVPVLITSNAGFTITVTPKDLVANQARAKLPPQSFQLAGNLEINSDTLMVKRATVESGSITIDINNSFEFPIQVNLTLPNITYPNSQVVVVPFSVNPGNRTVNVIQLANALFNLDDQNLKCEIGLSILPDQTKNYTISSGDELTVTVNISRIQLRSITGNFDIKTKFPEISQSVFKDMPDQLNNFSLDNAILTLDFINSPFDDMMLNISILASKNTDVRQFLIHQTVHHGQTLTLDKNSPNADGSSTTFIDILNLLPEEIVINGDVRVQGQEITFNKNDSLGVGYNIEVPLAFSLQGTSIAEHDTLKLKDDARDKIRDYLTSASVTLTVENALPISGSLSILVGQDSTHITNELFSVQLPQPVLDTNGRVTTPAIQTLTVSLTKEKFELLANSYFFEYAVYLNDTDLARLSANDYLIIRNVYVSGEVMVDPDGMSDDDDENDE